MKIIITEQQNEKLNRKIRLTVEKLGLPQSREMFGDDIIKQVYIDNPELFLTQFNNLKPIKNDKAIGYINDDDKLIFFYYFEDVEDERGYYYVNYDRIYIFYRDILGYTERQIEDMLKNWLSPVYNLDKLRPTPFFADFNFNQIF